MSGVEGVPDDIYQEVRRRGGKRIHDIIRLAFLVRKLTRLKVITCDFASKVVAYGDKYIPESMEMTYRDEELEQKGHQLVTKVFCTTEIGLIRSQKYPKDAEGKMRQRVSIALKPKVVLESQIREMVGKGPDASPECIPKLIEEGHNQGR